MTLPPADSLDDAFGPRPSSAPLGTVVGGSLSAGLRVKLNPQFSLEKLAVGRYVVIRGRETGRRFFGMLTDVSLEATHPDLGHRPPAYEDEFAAEVYGGEIAYGSLHVSPMLLIDEESEEPRPVKTIPAHFSSVYEATARDVSLIFGEEDKEHFYIGTPLDMDHVQINLDLGRLVERSSGVFGKSGTGKSFITRTLLAGVVRAGIASTLIFDMHNDYGWSVRDERGREFKGLRQLFTDGRVEVFTLDPETSRARDSRIDGELRIGLNQIEPDDLALLAGLLNLNEVQVGALFTLHRRLGPGWLRHILKDDRSAEIQAILDSTKVFEGTFEALSRRLESRVASLEFLDPERSDDPAKAIFDRLTDGKSVVLEFGRHGDNLAAYMLVANYLTRRIYEHYVRRKNLAAGKKADEPIPLVIVIEEAHKFLDRQVGQDAIFGRIARELRKYNVTLLIVDQRPSGIDDEVMSQIGTRVTCLLDNEADIKAVFSGVSGAGALREVLARLDTRQQALVLGHAVPMPVVLRTRDYDQTLYRALGSVEGEALRRKAAQGRRTLFGE
jgi:DNA helicase HerA-like ATPase